MKQNHEQGKATADGIIHTPGLNSSEINHMWNNYVDSSMIMCMISSFLTNVEDQNIEDLLVEANDIVGRRQQMVVNIMNKENMPIPIGFSADADVDFRAPRLYSDTFYLNWLRFLQRFEIPLGSLDFVTSTRSDVMDYYDYRMTSSTQLFKKITKVSLEKGLYVRAPYITVVNDVDKVYDKKFLTGYFGPKRPLLAQEISALYHIIQPNYLGRFILTGFRQTASSKQVRKYMDWGVDLSTKMIETFRSIMESENIQVPTFSDTMVTDSTVPPFSDNLMMHSLTLLNTAGFFTLSYVLKNSFRHDIKGALAKMAPDINDYQEEGLKLRMENGWFEEPPRTVDRRELLNKNTH